MLEILNETAIYPQRINDLIKGKREFTIQQSLEIEKVLGIKIEGYFYRIQANYQIYHYLKEQKKESIPDLSKFSKALFWDTKVDKITWNENKEWVIQRVFEYGDRQEIEEIIRFYGKETVKSVLSAIKSDWRKDNRDKNIKKYLQ